MPINSSGEFVRTGTVAAREPRASSCGRIIGVIVVVGIVAAILLSLLSMMSTQAQEQARSATATAYHPTAQAIMQSTQATATAAGLAAEVIQGEMHQLAQDLTGRAQLLEGPHEGELEHNPYYYQARETDSQARNFIAQVRIFNPANQGGSARYPWRHGVFFRDTGTHEEYRLYMDSRSEWQLAIIYGSGFKERQKNRTVATGTIPRLDVSEGGSNEIKLYAVDDKAYFFVNNYFVDVLDISEKQETGNIAVAVSATDGNGSTRYEDFTVWALP